MPVQRVRFNAESERQPQLQGRTNDVPVGRALVCIQETRGTPALTPNENGCETAALATTKKRSPCFIMVLHISSQGLYVAYDVSVSHNFTEPRRTPGPVLIPLWTSS